MFPSLEPDRLEPLFALYEPQMLSVIKEAVSEGVRAPHRLAKHCRVKVVTPPSELAAAWFNANTPEDLRRLSDKD